MKRGLLLGILVISALFTQAQENRFTAKLDKFCRTAIQSFKIIQPERKMVLDEMARQLARKHYVVFSCKTNSRRTLILQVWSQTAFYYYGLYNKHAFSTGDTVTPVYPRVAWVLQKSGFYVSNLLSAEPKGYMISISSDYPQNILSSKDEIGTIDTLKGLVVSICEGNEETGNIAGKTNIHLPYQSPTVFENTIREKQKYLHLNFQIALEMLYLAARTRELALQQEIIRF